MCVLRIYQQLKEIFRFEPGKMVMLAEPEKNIRFDSNLDPNLNVFQVQINSPLKAVDISDQVIIWYGRSFLSSTFRVDSMISLNWLTPYYSFFLHTIYFFPISPGGQESDNLQYNTLGRWVNCLIDQAFDGPSIILID